MEDWNRNEWQGKRKDQIEYSRMVTSISMVLIVVIFLVYGICYLCGIKL
jgi:uncharacterized membrane protein YidH (DUF202 family)